MLGTRLNAVTVKKSMADVMRLTVVSSGGWRVRIGFPGKFAVLGLANCRLKGNREAAKSEWLKFAQRWDFRCQAEADRLFFLLNKSGALPAQHFSMRALT